MEESINYKKIKKILGKQGLYYAKKNEGFKPLPSEEEDFKNIAEGIIKIDELANRVRQVYRSENLMSSKAKYTTGDRHCLELTIHSFHEKNVPLVVQSDFRKLENLDARMTDGASGTHIYSKIGNALDGVFRYCYVFVKNNKIMLQELRKSTPGAAHSSLFMMLQTEIDKSIEAKQGAFEKAEDGVYEVKNVTSLVNIINAMDKYFKKMIVAMLQDGDENELCIKKGKIYARKAEREEIRYFIKIYWNYVGGDSILDGEC